MSVVFQVEHWRNVQPEMPALIADHWAEIALDHSAVPLKPDWDRYNHLADAGQLHMVTARENGALIGYHIAIVGPHLHYRTTKHGITDVYYIRPEHRKGMTGVRLFKKVEESLRAIGVKKLITGTKMHKDIGVVLQRLGYRPTETVYTKVLED